MLKHAPHQQLTSGVNVAGLLRQLNNKFIVAESSKVKEEEVAEASQNLEMSNVTETETNVSFASPVLLLDCKQSPVGVVNMPVTTVTKTYHTTDVAKITNCSAGISNKKTIETRDSGDKSEDINDTREFEVVKTEVIDSGDESDDFANA